MRPRVLSHVAVNAGNAFAAQHNRIPTDQGKMLGTHHNERWWKPPAGKNEDEYGD